jgi:hypothetical protein
VIFLNFTFADKKRQIYDQFGHEGLSQQNGTTPNHTANGHFSRAHHFNGHHHPHHHHHARHHHHGHSSGINFIKVLQAAFLHTDPKSAKKRLTA